MIRTIALVEDISRGGVSRMFTIYNCIAYAHDLRLVVLLTPAGEDAERVTIEPLEKWVNESGLGVSPERSGETPKPR